MHMTGASSHATRWPAARVGGGGAGGAGYRGRDMLHPIGTRAPGVYWRRRLALFGALVALIGLTVWVLRPGGDSNSDAAAPVGSSPRSAAPGSTRPPGSGAASTRRPAPAKPTRAAPSPAAPVAPCAPAALKVAAAVDRSSYRVGEHPVVLLQVTNAGPVPCAQDLADSQVELRVYNGESRVWGSHDCTIQPGTAVRTLAVGHPVRVSVVWSGLSSQPKCAGTRQRVGAGTYTLYALLSGRLGTAAQFSVS
jgi:hypothetical protein